MKAPTYNLQEKRNKLSYIPIILVIELTYEKIYNIQQYNIPPKTKLKTTLATEN